MKNVVVAGERISSTAARSHGSGLPTVVARDAAVMVIVLVLVLVSVPCRRRTDGRCVDGLRVRRIFGG